MLLIEKELEIPTMGDQIGLLAYLERSIQDSLAPGEVPVRFVVTKTDSRWYHCELGLLTGIDGSPVSPPRSIFNFSPRTAENTDQFNAVLVVPTGIGAEIGGHAGDAAPVARLVASACDTLITHPNVVNASDINELPENGLYVEGSVLSRLLMGTIALQKVRSNRVLLVIPEHEDKRLAELAVNMASAARAALGLDCPQVVKIDPSFSMEAKYSSSGSAVGRIEGLEGLYEILLRYRSTYDAVAISSVIDSPEGLHEKYFEEEGQMVNPWGGVEAMLTHSISMLFDVPSAHAPMMESMEIANLHVGVVEPRMSAEAVSSCFLYSVLKGLHRSPQIVPGDASRGYPGLLSVADVSCLIIPDGCVGLPTLAALEQGIPVIAVRENRNQMKNDLEALPFTPGKLFVVDNYLEAIGVMAALKAGVTVSSVRRPLPQTKVVKETTKEILRTSRT